MNFEIIRPDRSAVREIPLIVHAPHSSNRVPADIRPQLLLGDEDLALEHLRLVDHFTDTLFASALGHGATLFTSRLSRLVVDPERFLDDRHEAGSAHGMGAVYLKTHDGRNLRRLDFAKHDRQALLKRFYEPYHQAMNSLVDEFLGRYGCCWIIDGHSFPSEPLSFENPELKRPDICLGFDNFHKPTEWVDWWERRRALLLAGDAGEGRIEIGFNEPFAGSFVSGKHHEADSRVSSLMIELKRSTYMDEATGKKILAMSSTREDLDDFMRFACQGIEDVVRPPATGISRSQAMNIAQRYLATAAPGCGSGRLNFITDVRSNEEIIARGMRQVSSLWFDDQAGLDDCWVAYLRSRPGVLCSSLVVVVDRKSGEVVYAGSAHDEG